MKRWVAILIFLFIFPKQTITSASEARYFQDRSCLAETIYREARGEPTKGKIAVGMVVLNRVKHSAFPDTICDVVFQKYQFSWVPTLKRYKAPKYYISLAEDMIHGKIKLNNFHATHFHATYVSPGWKLRRLITIGNHIFYKL